MAQLSAILLLHTVKFLKQMTETTFPVYTDPKEWKRTEMPRELLPANLRLDRLSRSFVNFIPSHGSIDSATV